MPLPLPLPLPLPVPVSVPVPVPLPRGLELLPPHAGRGRLRELLLGECFGEPPLFDAPIDGNMPGRTRRAREEEAPPLVRVLAAEDAGSRRRDQWPDGDRLFAAGSATGAGGEVISP